MDKLQILPFEADRHESLIEPLTSLLHTSYAPLAARGMRYLATHQKPDVTRERLLAGESYLGFWADELISTITLKPTQSSSSCAWYNTPGVSHFSQFAVHPGFQGRGIGSRMMDFVENRARQLEVRELALDTSEHADNLIAMYTKRGYRFIQHAQWEQVNYRSVILSKTL